MKKNSFFEIGSIFNRINKKKSSYCLCVMFFMLLNTSNVLSIEKNNNVKNINLSKKAQKLKQTREEYNKLYHDVVTAESLVYDEIHDLQPIYNNKLNELHERYPNLTLKKIKEQNLNLKKNRKKIEIK